MEYRIEGSDLQFVRLSLAPGESAVGEPGAMMYVDEGIVMETRLGDGVEEGLLARSAGAFKRMLTGESLFTTVFTNETNRPLHVAFAAPSPGKIMAVDLAALGGSIICQKRAFMAGAQGVRVGLAFKKRLRVGFFGGEGFILQRLTGSGIAFIHASGTMTQIDLAPGQALRVDTGCLAALTPSATYDVKYVGKIKTSLFGGEGLFLAHLKGPGSVWLQSLPLPRLVKELNAGTRPRGIGARLVYFGLIILSVLFAILADKPSP